MPMERKLVIVQAAALGYDLLRRNHRTRWQGHDFHPLESVFPALTCTAQASFRTAASPQEHGMAANGVYDRALSRPFFWEQSSALVTGPRIWERYRAAGKRVAMLCWQQSLGENVDILLSPAPIHKHGGGMIQSVYSRPACLYDALRRRIGRNFELARYWGPFASSASSEWIAQATADILLDSQSPDLCLVYLPALDYDLQRYGPEHPRAGKALGDLFDQLDIIHTAARKTGHEVLVFGDYAIGPARSAVYPNRILAAQGWLATRSVRGMSYPDFFSSRAFALVDHEIAHVYVKHAADIPAVRQALSTAPGIAAAAGRGDNTADSPRHANAGELILTAEEGFWFAYPWWNSRREEPDFAGHVDIHNKPGYDPCELFLGWPPGSVSRDTSRIKGSHGRTGPGRQAAWTASFDTGGAPATLVDLARLTQRWLEAGL